MPRETIRVGVLFGGKSGEHEVSLRSAETVIRALDEAGYQTVCLGITTSGEWITSGDPFAQLANSSALPHTREYQHRQANQSGQADSLPSKSFGIVGSFPKSNGLLEQTIQNFPTLCLSPSDKTGKNTSRMPAVDLIFPVLHGPYGEDGTIQGLLEMAGLPYIGCGVLASAVGMDKIAAKALFSTAAIPQVEYRTLLRRDWAEERDSTLDELEAALPYPQFVKPANLGSSVGVSKVKNRAELACAIDLACSYDRKVLVEVGIENARELEVSVLGNDAPQASVVGEVIPANEFYDYEAKYLDEGSQLLIPADIPASLSDRICRLAVRAFQILDGAGLARADFLLDGTGQLFLNELNTMPGFTASSMYPKLWEASGVPLPELVHRLVSLALERHADRQQNRILRGERE